MAVFIICFTALSLTIALSLFSVGMWPVLPFAILHVFVLGVAMGYGLRRSQGYERITVTADEVCVLKSEFGRLRRYNFPRYWARVRLEPGASRLRPSRLLIGSHGRFVEIGREFVDPDRENFAACLTQVLRSGGRAFEQFESE